MQSHGLFAIAKLLIVYACVFVRFSLLADVVSFVRCRHVDYSLLATYTVHDCGLGVATGTAL